MAKFDLAIIGGGINGTAIARDAAGRGLRVLLVEQNDLASGTSSASSKLIHGGLRYLEHFEFRLVREALTEREVLLAMAPHIIRPLRFMLPPAPGLRSAFKLWFGLFIYDRLGGRKMLPPTRFADLTHHPVGVPLLRSFRFGFEYSDCQVDDARLVILNALDAHERGATILTRTRCVRAERRDDWELVLNTRGKRKVVTARVLVNAAGPWVDQVAETILRMPPSAKARLVKGSHMVVRRLFDHDRAYTFQAADGRVVFALPFAQDFTLIGTTDENFVGDVNAPAPSPAELTYLVNVVNGYLRKKVSLNDVIWTFSGVRPLYNDGSDKPEDITRDYVLMLNERRGEAPLLTIFGGKITTSRRLAEAVFGKIGSFFQLRPPWTAHEPLPGGDFAVDEFNVQVTRARNRWPFLSAPTVQRMVHAYGTRIDRILGDAKNIGDLGPRFVGDLTGAEVRYLMQHEWAKTADDILWRRTKLGLLASGQDREAIAQFMDSYAVAVPA